MVSLLAGAGGAGLAELPCLSHSSQTPCTITRKQSTQRTTGPEAPLTSKLSISESGVSDVSSASFRSGGSFRSRTMPRLTEMALNAGLKICGANGMGFYNPGLQLYAGIFQRPAPVAKGAISYIAQSGSAFTALVHNGKRLGFNLCVSAGDEMTTTVADYMDWCLEREDTRVIALFLETVRDPAAFVAALVKARQRQIPVVVLKIGKSALGASMAVTHTGAIARCQGHS